MKCRHCGSELSFPLIDLGTSPRSNDFLTSDRLAQPETWYPLRVLVCESCWLVQTEDHLRADEHFDHDYAYFSSYSSSWVAHADGYVAQMSERFGLSASSKVVEVAANDGYLLQHVARRGIPCLGIEPTASTAAVARSKGLSIVEDFFGTQLAPTLVRDGWNADLIAANNVLAHVPDINDFVRGFAMLLRPDGVATFEFPHLLRTVAEGQFDTIYHEHYSYLSLTVLERIFPACGLQIFDVEELKTHGGSLRVYAQRSDVGRRERRASVEQVLGLERDAQLDQRAGFEGFSARAERAKNEAVRYLVEAKLTGKKIAAYGAAAKGNTFLNFAGIRSNLISFVIDANPAKQGKLLPGSRIPVLAEGALREQRPDVIALLPWNLREELLAQLSYVHEWGAELVLLLPRLEVHRGA